MKDNKNDLLQFILENMDSYDLDRRCNHDFVFENLEMFQTYQREAIDLIDKQMMTAMTGMMHLIKMKTLHNMDKESMASFRSSGFYLFPQGQDIKLCVFNER